jgi:hypothetical protein
LSGEDERLLGSGVRERQRNDRVVAGGRKLQFQLLAPESAVAHDGPLSLPLLHLIEFGGAMGVSKQEVRTAWSELFRWSGAAGGTAGLAYQHTEPD